MGTVLFGRIAKYPNDGTYWTVDGQPVMFDPPALTVERVRMHYPSVRDAKRLSGAQWWALVKVIEERVRPNQSPEALEEATRERVSIIVEEI
jgi:hypothetical protein